MKRTLFVILAILLLTGCIGLGSTAEPTWDTVVPPPTETATATQIPATATQEPPPERPELITLNKVANPNFTAGGHADTMPDGTVVQNVPNDWLVWTRATNPETGATVWPELYQEGNPKHIYADFAAWSIKTSFVALDSGLYQHKFDLQPGAVYQFSCYALVYSGDAIAGTPSTAPIYARLGIDPLAGDDPDAASILWSPWAEPRIGAEANVFADAYGPGDVYHRISVDFTAQSEEATLWIHGQSEFPTTASVLTVDSCQMRALGWEEQFYTGAPPATDEPVHTPTPIAAGTPLPPEAVGTFKALETLRVRIGHEVADNDTGERVAAGTEGLVYDTHEENGDTWLCIDSDTFRAWTDDNHLVEQEDCIGWVAAEYQGQVLADYELVN